VLAEIVIAAGVALQLPAGWHALRMPSTPPPVVDPVTRLVVSSAPTRWNNRPCQVAQFAPPRTAVTVVVLEWRRSYSATRWPRWSRQPVPLRLGAMECYSGWGGVVTFGDHGRHFGLYVMAGRGASPALVRRAQLVARSLKLLRR
jgi:hypothetical protein